MNLRVVRLIFGRELTDLLRDRRSVVLLFLLPVLLYPGFGLIGFYFALTQLEQTSVIAVIGMDHLPAAGGPEPALLVDGVMDRRFGELANDAGLMRFVPFDGPADAALDAREFHAVMSVPADFRERLAADQSAAIEIGARDGDELAKLAVRRLSAALHKYGDALRQSRFERRGLPADFHQPLIVREPKHDETPLQRSSDEVRDRLAKFFPFMLVMWALAGALHPAIDLCAGEKERGTMETLLISPASRAEIVAGKWAAVWAYSTATAWWNLVWMGGLCLLGSWYFQVTFLRPTSLIVCYVLTVPLTAMFSALCLALGVYARSTKEGQYYLLPLFLGVMPLVLLSLLPTTELNWRTSLIPVTGMCLLLQKLIGPTPWAESIPYLPVVFAGLAACVAASGAWAVRQFHREDVLFRESDGLPGRGWLSGFDEAPA
jgi:sodium transport system permease protein